jgi:hypothetical protein
MPDNDNPLARLGSENRVGAQHERYDDPEANPGINPNVPKLWDLSLAKFLPEGMDDKLRRLLAPREVKGTFGDKVEAIAVNEFKQAVMVPYNLGIAMLGPLFLPIALPLVILPIWAYHGVDQFFVKRAGKKFDELYNTQRERYKAGSAESYEVTSGIADYESRAVQDYLNTKTFVAFAFDENGLVKLDDAGNAVPLNLDFIQFEPDPTNPDRLIPSEDPANPGTFIRGGGPIQGIKNFRQKYIETQVAGQFYTAKNHAEKVLGWLELTQAERRIDHRDDVRPFTDSITAKLNGNGFFQKMPLGDPNAEEHQLTTDQLYILAQYMDEKALANTKPPVVSVAKILADALAKAKVDPEDTIRAVFAHINLEDEQTLSETQREKLNGLRGDLRDACAIRKIMRANPDRVPMAPHAAPPDLTPEQLAENADGPDYNIRRDRERGELNAAIQAVKGRFEAKRDQADLGIKTATSGTNDLKSRIETALHLASSLLTKTNADIKEAETLIERNKTAIKEQEELLKDPATDAAAVKTQIDRLQNEITDAQNGMKDLETRKKVFEKDAQIALAHYHEIKGRTFTSDPKIKIKESAVVLGVASKDWGTTDYLGRERDAPTKVTEQHGLYNIQQWAFDIEYGYSQLEDGKYIAKATSVECQGPITTDLQAMTSGLTTLSLAIKKGVPTATENGFSINLKTKWSTEKIMAAIAKGDETAHNAKGIKHTLLQHALYASLGGDGLGIKITNPESFTNCRHKTFGKWQAEARATADKQINEYMATRCRGEMLSSKDYKDLSGIDKAAVAVNMLKLTDGEAREYIANVIKDKQLKCSIDQVLERAKAIDKELVEPERAPDVEIGMTPVRQTHGM